MDVVTKVLEEAAKHAEQFKSIHVEKHLELEYDLGTLLAVDTNDLDLRKIRFVACIGYGVEWNFIYRFCITLSKGCKTHDNTNRVISSNISARTECTNLVRVFYNTDIHKIKIQPSCA